MKPKISYPKFVQKSGKRVLVWSGTREQAMDTLSAMHDRRERMMRKLKSLRIAGRATECAAIVCKAERYLGEELLPFAAFAATLHR